MFRSVTPYEEVGYDRDEDGNFVRVKTGRILHRYAGPYATVGPAKAARGPGGWIEVCHPVWEKLEE